MIVKEYVDFQWGEKVKVTATMTEEEYNTVLSMAKNYQWNEVSAVMVLRGYRDKTMWDRVKIERLPS